MHALLFFAHLGCVGEELLGEEWSVEVCGRGGVDGSCLQARRCKQCSGSSERRRRKHGIYVDEVRQQWEAISKTRADGTDWPQTHTPLPITMLMRVFSGKARQGACADPRAAVPSSMIRQQTGIEKKPLTIEVRVCVYL